MPSLSSRALWRLACLSLLAVWLAAYANSLGNSFHFDDDHVIERNQYIRSLRNIPRFFTDARTFSTFASNANYRPLESLTLAIDYSIHWLAPHRIEEMAPGPFHVDQLLEFLFLGFLLFVVTKELLKQNGEQPWHKWAALFTTGFFCIHTANTEVGNYICARSELLSGAGVLGAFAVYLRWPRLRKFQLFIIPMFIGCLAKTPAIVFGGILLSYKLIYEADLRPIALRTRDGWIKIGRAVLTSIPTLAASAATYKFVEGMNPPGQNYGGTRVVQYVWTQAWVSLRYWKLFFLPTGLTADSDMGPLPKWQDPRVLAGVLVLVVSLLLALWAATRRNLRPFALGIIWFWGGIAPGALVPLAEVTNDHRMFLGFMGLAIAFTTILFELGTAILARSKMPDVWRGAFVGAAVVLLCAHAVGTHFRNRDWLDESTLWADTVRKSPGNGRAWMNYGLTEMAKGKYDSAKVAFDRAATLTPYYALLAVNRGILAGAMGDPMTAEIRFREAQGMIPHSGAAPFYYGNFLINQGRAAEAIPLLESAAKLDWGDTRPRHLLLELEAACGDQTSVQKTARDILGLADDPEANAWLGGSPPFHPEKDDAKSWFNLGLTYTNRKDATRAATAYRVALRRDPKYADAWLNLGWSMLTLGFDRDSIPDFRETLRLRPEDSLAKNNLAEAVRRIAKGGRSCPQPKS